MLVGAGDNPGANEQFIGNLKEFILTQKILISHILITNAHHDHISGLNDIINLLKPQVL